MRGFGHPLSRIPQPWRHLIDWAATISVAILFVLTFEAQVAQPYRIPSSSMENGLHCAKPGGGCLGSVDDRVLALRLEYDFESPQRGQIVVFTAPATASRCAAGDGGTTFVKRIVGLPGETVRENGRGFISVREPGSTTWTRLDEPYVAPAYRRADAEHFGRTWHVPNGDYFVLGGQPRQLLRLTHVGSRTAREPDRAGRSPLLAAGAHRFHVAPAKLVHRHLFA